MLSFGGISRRIYTITQALLMPSDVSRTTQPRTRRDSERSKRHPGNMNADDKYQEYADLPIPTYDEATSSRPTSSNRGTQGSRDDVERQGLLGNISGDGYRPPTVDSARSSEDSDLRLPEVRRDGDNDRRQIEELDYLDPSSEASRGERGLYHRARLRSNFSKHLANLSATFSSLRLPSFRSFYSPVSASDNTDSDTPAPTDSSWRSSARRCSSNFDKYRISGPILARLVGLFILITFIYTLFALDMFPTHRARMSANFDPEAVRIFVQENVDAGNIAEYLRHITSYDHIAGTEGDYYLAEWMQEMWIQGGGFDGTEIGEYYVYLNYPTEDGRSVSIVEPEEKRWTAILEEDVIDPNTRQTLAFHGHSKSGEARGHLIYANGGSREDFEWLQDHGVATKGAIALVRYYGTQGDRALKIKAAEEAGCVGALIYSDPSDDGVAMGPVWPDGPWRPADSLQRGGVSLMSWVVGDPLTPGWASTPDAKRLNKEDVPGLVQIPSLPLAWRDAKVMIDALANSGPEVPATWSGGESGHGKDQWFAGGKDAPVVELKNLQDENEKQRIWNVYGLIEGIETPEKKVIVGNHRDAWCFGALDPGSGSAVMMEVVAIFSALRRLGWRPLRTIEFISWDAEEYNLVGSTEYVEDKMAYLREHGVAYINVDVGVDGPNFRAAASPLWGQALSHVLGRVNDPYSNSTLREIWEKENTRLEGLGAGSDYVAFQDMAGTSSIDFGFEGQEYANVYHSCYENFEWMVKFGDPEFKYHHTLAQVWALLILEVSDRPIIPFDLSAYADALDGYVDQLEKDASVAFESTSQRLDVAPLRSAIKSLHKNVEAFHRFEDVWTTGVLGNGGFESAHFTLQRLDYNKRLAHFETDLLDLPTSADDKGQHGVPGREQFKHVVFGPQTWSGYDAAYFPAVRDALGNGNVKQAQEMLVRAAQVIERAGENLVRGK